MGVALKLPCPPDLSQSLSTSPMSSSDLSSRAKLNYDSDKFTVEFNVAEYSPEDLHIKTEGDVLIVSAKQESKTPTRTVLYSTRACLMTNPSLPATVSRMASPAWSMVTITTRSWSTWTSTIRRSWSSRPSRTRWWWRPSTRRRHQMAAVSPPKASVRASLCPREWTPRLSSLLCLRVECSLSPPPSTKPRELSRSGWCPSNTSKLK